MITIPSLIENQLDLGAAVVISISGGKDSQALLKAVTETIRSKGYQNELFAIHAHLGRTEWPQTLTHCKKICKEVDIPLVIVQRDKGDLLARWKERQEKLKGTGKPFWSSSAARYCTSDLKRAPINKHLRKYDRVISVEGIRAEESRNRAKKPEWEIRKKIHNKSRTAYTWNAILNWTEEQVWKSWGQNKLTLQVARNYYKMFGDIIDGWNFHPAYAMGNDRVSCIICILQSKKDRRNGVKNAPELTNELIKMEKESGFTFWPDQSISEVKQEVENASKLTITQK